MTPEEWEHISDLFDRVSSRPVAERDAFFAKLDDEPAEVIAQVRALLDEHDNESHALLDHPQTNIARQLSAQSPPEAPPDRIGAYRIVREIGRGGMGVVYLAQRDDGQFEQDVALKVVRRGIDSEEVRQRFFLERQLLAKLQHPGIANLLDGGISDDGRPFFALEYIDGDALFDYCDAHTLSIDQRLRLFIRICDAVHYAHQALIVHRDLKPSNILVTKNGEPRLLDFGIAKLLDVGAVTDTPHTRAGMYLLTPEYGAPEQLRGDLVTTAADVYALGVILYELLSGNRPYAFSSHSPVAIYEAITKSDPERPSASVARDAATMTSVTQSRGTSPKRLRRRLRGDLDVITMTAIAKEPSRRYSSAGALGRDIRRYLDRRPIHSRADSVSYRIGRFLRRHTIAVTASAVMLLSLIGGLAAVAWQGRIAAREGAKADAVSTFLLDMLASANPDSAKGRDLTVRELVDSAARRLDDNDGAVSEPQVEAAIRATLGSTLRGLGKYEEALSQYHQAIALSEDSPAASVADVLQMKSDLGASYFDAGRVDEAAPIYREVLDTSARVLGADHFVTRQAMARFAGIHFRRGDLAAAEALLRDAVEAGVRTVGPDHSDTLGAKSNLAASVARQGRLEEAAELLGATLESLRRLHGEHDRRTLLASSNLANVQGILGNTEAAVALHEQGLAVRREMLEPGHPELLDAIGRLAGAYHEADRLQEARALFEEALPVAQERLGADHQSNLLLRGNYALLQVDLGQRDAGIASLRTVVDKFADVAGTEHPLTMSFRAELERVADSPEKVIVTPDPD